MNKNPKKYDFYLETEKSFYYPGDTVSGHIYLNFSSSNFPGNQLLLKIKGKEETSWDFPNQDLPNAVEKKTGLIIFYNHKFPIFIWNEGFVPSGQYDFPFSFLLKDFLPGSYYHRKDENDRRTHTNAVIKYKIKAECLALDSEKEMSKIKYTKELMVREKLKVNIFSKGEISLPLSSCICLAQGTCNIRCYFEKNAYESGEEANVFCEIDNSLGALEIRTIAFELKNKVLLRSDEGVNKEYVKSIFKKEIQGIASHQKAEGAMKKSIKCLLNSNQGNLEEFKNNEQDDAFQLQESSSGQLINSTYFLEVTADASGFLSCKSAEHTQIPVTIYKKTEPVRKMEGGDWQPKMMEVVQIVVTEGAFYRRGNKKK